MKTSQKMIRFLFFIAAWILIIVSIAWKQAVIRKERNREIVSTYGVWERTGKPVEILVMRKENIPVFTKFTVTPVSSTESNVDYEGYITRNVFEQLKTGQDIAVDAGEETINGRIETVNSTAKEDIGLYHVKVNFEKAIPSTIKMPVCAAETKKFTESLRVPVDLVVSKGEKTFVWIVDEQNQAHLREINIASKNGYGLIVASGLAEGDRVITKGMALLKDGELVNVL